jgi:hypothetical protein
MAEQMHCFCVAQLLVGLLTPRCIGSHQPTQRVEHGAQIVFPLFAVQAA